MILGLPWDAWLLIAASVLPGLGLAIAFYRAHTGPDSNAPRDGRG